MKSLLLVLAMLGTAYADKFPASGPCEDIETCETACAKNKKGTCYWGGVLVLQGAPEGRHEHARKLFDRACAKGDGEACYQLARVIWELEYKTNPASGPETMAAYKRACGKHHARACRDYAYHLGKTGDAELKQQAAAMNKKYAQLLSQRCLKRNIAAACGWAAWLYEEGHVVPKSEKLAKQLRARACKLDSTACP